MIDRPLKLDQRTQTSGAPTAVRSILSPPRTTLVERFLLVTSIILLPLQNNFAVAGVSLMFLVYGALAAYVIVNRLRILGETWCHPVFIACYAFVVVSVLLEYSSPLSSFSEISRFAQMTGGAVCVAVLCRDRSALSAGMYAYIATAMWLSVVLYSTGYGALQEVQADNFHQASGVRSKTFEDRPVEANLNTMAFLCAQGAIVAFALSLSCRLKYLRSLLLGIAGFCLIAAFLPMSRGVVMASAVCAATILYAHGAKQGKALILAAILGMGIYLLVPDAVWSRMAFSTDVGASGKMEARAYIYTAALNRLPEYILSGVGAGNFMNKWGAEKGFMRGGVVLGAHNAFLQITIFWGVLSLSMFVWIIWCVYRSVPLHCGRDQLALALVGILVSLGLSLMQGHGFYSKSNALGIGMLVGARLWIWPRGIVSAVEVNRCPSAGDINISPDCHSR
nr:O-antigen ligase family protein [Nitrosomonas nitrosa]